MLLPTEYVTASQNSASPLGDSVDDSTLIFLAVNISTYPHHKLVLVVFVGPQTTEIMEIFL